MHVACACYGFRSHFALVAFLHPGESTQCWHPPHCTIALLGPSMCDHAAISRDTETKVPTIALIITLRDKSAYRPCARPHLLTRQGRMADRSFWAHFALHDRGQRTARGYYYLPPCLVCAQMTGSFCDDCSLPLCTTCEEEEQRTDGPSDQGGTRECPQTGAQHGSAPAEHAARLGV